MRSYREQLYVPVSYWLLSVPVVVLLGAEVFVGFSTLVAALVYVAFVVVVGGFLLSWGVTRIEVTGTVLKAGGDILSLSQVSEVLPLDDKEAALLRGPRANPAAHLLLRPYLKRAVYIGLPDSLDGVPYWLVATRHPNELAVALTDAAALTDTALSDTALTGAGRPTTDPARRDAKGLSGPGQRRGMIPGSEAQGLPAATGTRRNDGEAAG
jgi:hypothetical protein